MQAENKLINKKKDTANHIPNPRFPKNRPLPMVLQSHLPSTASRSPQSFLSLLSAPQIHKFCLLQASHLWFPLLRAFHPRYLERLTSLILGLGLNALSSGKLLLSSLSRRGASPSPYLHKNVSPGDSMSVCPPLYPCMAWAPSVNTD